MRWTHARASLWRSLMSLMALCSLYCEVGYAIGNAEVDKYLELGTKLLAAGQLADALAQYNLAVEADPDNYIIYFRRATAYLAMGKTKSAFPDLEKVLELKPDFHAARMQRGNLFLKQGKIGEAKLDYRYLIDHTDSAEAQESLNSVFRLAELVESAKSYYENHQFGETIDVLGHAIDIAPMQQELREMRAKSYLNIGDKHKAIQDFRHSVKMTNDNMEGLLKLSQLMYDAGEAEQALIEIRECLRLDPDHKACFTHYKKLKKLVKLLQSTQEASNEKRYDDCLKKADQLERSEGHIEGYKSMAKQHLCHCQANMGSPDAINTCTEAHEFSPGNMDILCDRAEAHILLEEYNEAITDYQKVLENDRHDERAKKGMKKAQKLLKTSRKRDYYKILSVARSAPKRDILRAYRKLAAQWHPDHYKGKDKEKAQRMFIDLSDAKEVLTDPEKREKFDNGEDPLDPEQQHQGGGHGGGGFTFHNFDPFGDGGGGGGGFQYEFHFG